jgi:hypothetical protein
MTADDLNNHYAHYLLNIIVVIITIISEKKVTFC